MNYTDHASAAPTVTDRTQLARQQLGVARIGTALFDAAQLAVKTPVDFINHTARAVDALGREIEERTDITDHTRAVLRGALGRMGVEAFHRAEYQARRQDVLEAVREAEEATWHLQHTQGGEAARGHVETMLAAQVFSPEHGETLKRESLWRERHTNLESRLQARPHEVLELVDHPEQDAEGLLTHLEPEDFGPLRQRAHARQKQLHADEALRLSKRLEDPLFRPRGRFREELAFSGLSPATQEQLLHLHRTGEPQSWEMLTHVRGHIAAYDPDRDPAGQEYHRLREDIAMLAPARMRDWYLDKLEEHRAQLDPATETLIERRQEVMSHVEPWLQTRGLDPETEHRALLEVEYKLERQLLSQNPDKDWDVAKAFRRLTGEELAGIPKYGPGSQASGRPRIHRRGALSRLEPVGDAVRLQPVTLNALQKIYL